MQKQLINRGVNRTSSMQQLPQQAQGMSRSGAGSFKLSSTMRGGYNQRSGNIPEAKGMLLQTGRNSNCFKSNETQGKKKTKNQRGKGANNSKNSSH